MSTTTFSEQEALRLVGLRMLADGKTTGAIVEALGVGRSTVKRWRIRLHDFGGDADAAAHDAPRPGRPNKLTPEQKQQLRELLLAGAEAAGFEGALWTRPRVQRLIRERFHVDYHVDHLGRLLGGLHFSPQIPTPRANQRQESAIVEFRGETWPELVKKGR